MMTTPRERLERRSRLRPMRPLGDESGMTLPELLVSMSILGLVLLVFTSTMASVQGVVVREDTRSRLNNEARLVMQSIDRSVRSGNLLYDPASEVGNDPYDALASGYLFRVYTQAKFQPTDLPRCVLWLVDDQQQLLHRSWPALDPASATDWRVVATGVVNRDVAEPAFSISGAGRTIDVNFLVNPKLATDPNATQAFGASLTGRNTAFGFPVNVCETLPAL